MKNFIVLLFTVVMIACGEETLPKPKPYLKLQYPQNSYQRVDSLCPYSFEISNMAHVSFKDNCWSSITYPKLKATIHITYRNIDNNFDEILKEVEKLTFEHTVKADVIDALPYENFEKKVFGKVYNIEGNVASNIQFSITDSTNHVLAGALYFYTRPNYDSIIPAIKYIEKDIIHLVETVEWNK
jgi:gliding motility-associated lipoprotein GldD